MKKIKSGLFKIMYNGYLNWVPDKIYLKIMHRLVLGRKINFDNPKTFNEKLQWLKLYDRKDIYTKMVDKYEAKEYVKNAIGEEYIVQTIGIYNKFEEIDFDKLPNQFVIKCTHDSGSTIVCRDKTTFNIDKAKTKISKALKNNYFYQLREWPYKNVKPKILIEKYMESKGNKKMIDYKFFCFNEEPKFIYVSQGLENHKTAKISFFDTDFKKEKFKREDYKEFEELPQKPIHFEEMKRLARILAKETTFLRVDFYEINEKIYFSELTFFPCGGFLPFEPKEYDSILGRLIRLPEKGRKIMRGKRAIKNIIASLGQQLITIICGLILPIAIIKTYGSSVNGLISSITQFLAYITLLDAGIGQVIKAVLYKPIAKKDKGRIKEILKASQKFFNIIAYIFVIYIVLLCIIYPKFVNSQFEMGYTISLIIIISVSTFFEYFIGMVYKIYLQAEQKTYIIANLQTVSTILNTLVSVILIKIGSSIQTVKIISTIIFIIRPICQNIYVRKKYKINLNDKIEKYEIEQKWDGLAQHIASVIHNNTDVAVLTIFTNTVEVSVYTVYLFIIKGIRNIVQSFSTGIDAAFGNMYAKGEFEKLNENFEIYEVAYFTMTSILFSCTLGLILPFIQVYTKGISDADYYRPIFAYLIVISECIWAIRLPYSSISMSAGKFKETRRGAWTEAILNIVISTILVIKFGIVGVAIGTLVAMTIRTIEFINYTSKNILQRKQYHAYIKLTIMMIQMFIIFNIIKFIVNELIFNSYIIWIKYAVISTIIAIVIVLGCNLVIYKRFFKSLMKKIKNRN